MSWKPEMKVYKDPNWYLNGLTFATKAEAEAYGLDLYTRWTQAEAFRAAPSDEEPNYTFVDGKLTAIKKEG